MSNIKETEAVNFKKFKEVVKDLNQEDDVLLRFLRARSFDVKKAEEQLRKAMKWREDFGTDLMKDWSAPEEVKAELMPYYMGIDEENYPVYLSKIGSIDIRPLLSQGLKDDCLRFLTKAVEIGLVTMKKNGVSQFVAVLDCGGLTFAKAAHWGSLEFMIRVLKDFDAYYPETLKACYLVNCPAVFWYAYNILKYFLSSHTLSKIHIYDSDEAKWKQGLLDYIPKGSLAVEYGGSGNAQPIDNS